MTGPVFNVGLGKLGLGFVVPLLTGKAPIVGCHRELTPRTSPDKKEAYETLARTHRYRRIDTQTMRTDEFELVDVVAYGSEGLRGAAGRHGPPRVVTCAVGKGVADVTHLLADLVEEYREHYLQQPLVFVPFENARNVGTNALSEVRRRVPGSEGALIAVDTVVDKVCSEMKTAGGVCLVKAETAQHLVVGVPDGEDAVAVRWALEPYGLDRYVVERDAFEFEVRKKAWIVNGLHYCIAMVVVERNLDLTSIADALHHPDVADAALLFTKEVALALKVYAAEARVPFNEDEITAYITNVLVRMLTQPDEIGRMFSPLIHLHNFVVLIQAGLETANRVEFGDILRKWNERIVEPAEIVLRYHQQLDEPLVAARLSLFLLQWLSDYVGWLRAA